MGFKLDKDKGYFKNCGVDVMAFSDFYPMGHQSGISIIMHGKRVATNGDVRFEPTPGQWQPIPKQMSRNVDAASNSITTSLSYPNEEYYLKGFNPIIYPDFDFNYDITATGCEDHVTVRVSLDRPIPEEFIGKLRFNLELFPTDLFGKSYIMDENTGFFPTQPNGPTLSVSSNYEHSGHRNVPSDACASIEAIKDSAEEFSPIIADDIVSEPYAKGHCLTVCPEDNLSRLTIESDSLLELYDGRMNHNNGWFVVSASLPSDCDKHPFELSLYPNTDSEWLYPEVVQVSSVGYHPSMPKIAVIEMDSRVRAEGDAELIKIEKTGPETIRKIKLTEFGDFLRYHYYKADFSDVNTPGIYCIKFGKSTSSLFRIDNNVFERGVWQPVVEYFLPAQMCHMRVQEKYRVWHGLCHNDDARMAPVNYTQFDGVYQGPSTLTKYKSGEHVPGLNKGGWHDAGDFDLRIESQTTEVYLLSLAFEEFGAYIDETTINQEKQLVEIHQSDGQNDILQQIEHGLLSIVGAYDSLGRLYHEIISGNLRQYVLLGDPVNMTDGKESSDNERLVYTEDNPERELAAASHLACAARAMKDYSPKLYSDCVRIAEEIYDITIIPEDEETLLDNLVLEAWSNRNAGGAISSKIKASAELYLTTGNDKYIEYLKNHTDYIVKTVGETGWVVSKVLDKLDSSAQTRIREAVLAYREFLGKDSCANPYGIPYKPFIWGAGWGIEATGVKNYFLHKAFPDIFDREIVYNALNFILGCHPGSNRASFASGVGSNSVTCAYGFNRADYSFIPGGVVSGTALIRPDFPELLNFPFLWQQTEYVMGGGSSYFMLLVLAVSKLVNE